MNVHTVRLKPERTCVQSTSSMAAMGFPCGMGFRLAFHSLGGSRKGCVSFCRRRACFSTPAGPVPGGYDHSCCCGSRSFVLLLRGTDDN
eukprot:scaffold4240_cov163-Amphora_coffeaeformis.AAC.13